jgi:hypothetical protein
MIKFVLNDIGNSSVIIRDGNIFSKLSRCSSSVLDKYFRSDEKPRGMTNMY